MTGESQTNIPLKGQGGIQQIIEDVKQTPLQKIAEQALKIGTSSLPISEENKEALSKLGQQSILKISPEKTIGSIISKPSQQITQKVEQQGLIPKFKGISGWDKFKNFLGKNVGQKLGLTTHEITDDDYKWVPQIDKEGKTIIDQKTGQQKGQYKFDWTQARESDKKRGKATTTQFDINPLLSLGMKAISKM